MADPIRPLSSTPAPTAARPVSPQALAAQRAFFNAALGKAAAPTAASAPAPTVAPPAVTRAAPAAAPAQAVGTTQPARYARPGSRVDITV